MRPPAKWLVDRARDHGQALKGRPSSPDVHIVLTLMRAAARLDPNAPEPHRWQAELLDALDQPHHALDALKRYVDREPTDIAARLRWIGLAVSRLQTLEARERFVQRQLAQALDQPLIAADAQRRLAEIALTRADRAAARKHIEAALELAPCDVAANRLAAEIRRPSHDRAAQVRVALRLIAANPRQIDLIWQLANLLDDLALHQDAQFWYTHAIDVHRAANPGTDPSPRFLFDLARSRADGGDLQAAIKDCTEAVRIDPGYIRPRLLMVHILRKLHQDERVLAQIRTIAQHYAKLADRVTKTRDTRLATEMAWFYARYDRRPDEAMRFAKIAMAAPDPPDDARRAYGFAALAKKNLPEAERALQDLAATDQMAAVGLARIYLATKRSHRAVPVLQHAARIRATGIAHDEIVRMLEANGLSVPPVSDHPNVRKLLADFDRAPLEYYKEPDRFLRLTTRFVQPRLAPAKPWYVLFELKNIGPFAITLGREMMVRPKVLLSVTTSGDRNRQFPHYLLVDLGRTPILQAGQSIRVIQTVDVGPVQRAIATTPQADQHIRLAGILDPDRSPEGRWTHRLGGLNAPSASAERPAVDASEQAVQGLISALTSDQPSDVLRAAAVLTSLLAENEAIQTGEYEYKAALIDAPSVSRALLQAATQPDRDPVLHARLIESFRRVKLTNTMVKTLSGGLSDKQWLVRLATVWIFAHQQGRAFAAVARQLSQNDPDPLVRDLAAAYLAKWQPPPAPKP